MSKKQNANISQELKGKRQAEKDGKKQAKAEHRKREKQRAKIDRQVQSWQSSVVNSIYLLRAANSALLELLHDKGVITEEDVTEVIPKRVAFFFDEIIANEKEAVKIAERKIVEAHEKKITAEEAILEKRLADGQ